MPRWTRDQLLLALNLYHQTPFGKQHRTHPPIVELAERIGRTPSAVAMKLSNFTYLDPAEGGKGLSGASNADREIWEEFYGRFVRLADASEPILSPELATPTGPTETKSLVQQRRHQSFFRKAVLGSYGNRCCISGLPIPSLLRASHIIPWAESEDQRLNPANGICLAGTYDLAFDQFFITFTHDLKLVIGNFLTLHSNISSISSTFTDLEGCMLRMPDKNPPDERCLKWHRQKLR
jgi:putative restriction endonuclease